MPQTQCKMRAKAGLFICASALRDLLLSSALIYADSGTDIPFSRGEYSAIGSAEENRKFAAWPGE